MYHRGTRGIGANIAESTTRAIGRCTSYDPQNTSRITRDAIMVTIETTMVTIETTIMDTGTITITIDTTTSSGSEIYD
jgi:hypothetical protein